MKKITIEDIIAQLDRIAEDAYYTIDCNDIDLTIKDFEDFDDDYGIIDREFVDEDAVDEVLDWLKDNADSRDEDDCYAYYYFGLLIEVRVGYTSLDI